MDLIYISILLVAIAFAIVVGYLCFILKRLSGTMKTLTSTMNDVENQIEYMKPALMETLHESDRLIDDVEDKVSSTDSVFESLEELGMSINSANEAFHNRFGKLTDEEMDKKAKPFIESIRWSEAGMRLYSSWQNNKKADKNELMIREDNEIAKVSGREG